MSSDVKTKDDEFYDYENQEYHLLTTSFLNSEDEVKHLLTRKSGYKAENQLQTRLMPLYYLLLFFLSTIISAAVHVVAKHRENN